MLLSYHVSNKKAELFLSFWHTVVATGRSEFLVFLAYHAWYAFFTPERRVPGRADIPADWRMLFCTNKK